MMRHFFWLVANTPEVKEAPYFYSFRPWSDKTLPTWVESLVRQSGFDLDLAYKTIEHLATQGTAEELGGFIESNGLYDGKPGAGIHNRIHRLIHKWEELLNPDDKSSDMKDMGTAPASVFFWKLHSWIDEWYARWEIAHGKTPDRSPREMTDPHVHCPGDTVSFPP